MAAQKEPSMKDIARLAGVHDSTVSLALRGDPRVSEETRQLVRAAAEKLGYRPNPLVSALMSFRARRRKPAYQMELAFLAATETKEQWLRISEAYRRMWQGAKTRAEERGYLLNLYPRNAAQMSLARFAGVLRNRNVHGVVVAPMPTASSQLDVDWTDLSVVELGFTLAKPGFHRVVHDYFHAMLMALRTARSLGYRRVGLLLGSRADEKVHHLWRAAFIDEQIDAPAENRVKPLILPEITGAEMKAWLKQEKPDAIVTIETKIAVSVLKELKVAVPKDVGLVSLGCYSENEPIAGIYQAYEEMGATAVDQLVALVQRGERGIPKRTYSTLVGGVWVDGDSLPRRET